MGKEGGGVHACVCVRMQTHTCAHVHLRAPSSVHARPHTHAQTCKHARVHTHALRTHEVLNLDALTFGGRSSMKDASSCSVPRGAAAAAAGCMRPNGSRPFSDCRSRDTESVTANDSRTNSGMDSRHSCGGAYHSGGYS